MDLVVFGLIVAVILIVGMIGLKRPSLQMIGAWIALACGVAAVIWYQVL